MRPKLGIPAVLPSEPLYYEEPDADKSTRLGSIDGYIRQHGLDSARMMLASSIPTKPTAIIRWPEDIQSHVLTGFLDAWEFIGYDVETGGLDPRKVKLRLIQLAIPDGRVFVLNLEHPHASDWREIMRPLFMRDDVTLVGHNINFDLRFGVANGLEWPKAKVFDTMIAAQLLGASAHRAALGTYTLGTVAKAYLHVDVDKSLQRSFLDGLPISNEQIEYAAQDSMIVLALAQTLQDKLDVAALNTVAYIEMAALPAFASIQHNGMAVNWEQWANITLEAAVEIEQWEQELNTEYRRVAGSDAKTVDWGSHYSVLAALKTRPVFKSLTKTNVMVLSEYHKQDVIVGMLLHFRELLQKLKTFGMYWLYTGVNNDTERVHASTMQLGAETGRTSTRDPNMQQIPRAKSYRECFAAPKGRKIIDCDYSQIELRILAQITQDKRMLEAYRNGEDLHSVTAATVLDKPLSEVQHEDRQIAKSLNFGLIYGMGKSRLVTYAEATFHIKLTEERAIELRNSYFDVYPGVRAWHREQYEGYKATRTQGNRRRIQVEKFSDKLNSPVQGTGADMLKLSAGRLHAERAKFPSAFMINTIHDEIVMECDEDDAPAVAAWLQQVMEESGQIFLKDVPVVAEAHICDNWSEK